MFKRAFYSLLVLGMTAPALAKVEAVDGYVRLLPPGSPNTAAFMVLKNDADQPVKLVAAASAAAGRAELHTHLHENGVMKMRQVENIEIPAKGEAVLKPAACTSCCSRWARSPSRPLSRSPSPWTMVRSWICHCR